jgi:hypothetical protein
MPPSTLLVHDEFNVLHELPITFFQNWNKKTGLAILVDASDGDSVGPSMAVERLHEVRDRQWQCQLRGNGATATDRDYQARFFDVMALKGAAQTAPARAPANSRHFLHDMHDNAVGPRHARRAIPERDRAASAS